MEGRRKVVAVTEAKMKAYLNAGDRDTAARYALDLKRAKDDLGENEKQLALHEQAYQNNLMKIQHAIKKLDEVKHRITKYDADLKMSRAEAEISQLATQFHFDVTTDFGQAEQIIQDQIDRNRARVRVAADMSGEGVEEIQQRDRRGEDHGRGRAAGFREGGRASSRLRRSSRRSRRRSWDRPPGPSSRCPRSDRRCARIHQPGGERTRTVARSSKPTERYRRRCRRKTPAGTAGARRARLVSRLGARIRRPLFRRDDLRLRHAWERSRPDALRRGGRPRLRRLARVPGDAAVRLVGRRVALRSEPGPARYAGIGCRPPAPDDRKVGERIGEPKSWPRDPDAVLALLDQFVRQILMEEDPTKQISVGVIFEYAQYLVPSAELGQMAGLQGTRLVRLLSWAQNPYIKQHNIAFCLLCDQVAEINDRLIGSAHVANLEVPMPDAAARERFIARFDERGRDAGQPRRIHPCPTGRADQRIEPDEPRAAAGRRRRSRVGSSMRPGSSGSRKG